MAENHSRAAAVRNMEIANKYSRDVGNINVVGGRLQHLVLGAVEDVNPSELALSVTVLSGLRAEAQDERWINNSHRGRAAVYCLQPRLLKDQTTRHQDRVALYTASGLGSMYHIFGLHGASIKSNRSRHAGGRIFRSQPQAAGSPTGSAQRRVCLNGSATW